MSDEVSEQEEIVVVEEKPKRKPRRKMVDVIIVAQEGDGALVQWVKPNSEKLARGYIPVETVEDGKCDAKALEAAQPYGVPWSTLIDALQVTPERVEAELYRRNIWTVADLENNTQLVMRALTLIVGPIIGVLHQRGRDHERFEKEEGKYNAITE